jgi:hypothetical protein
MTHDAPTSDAYVDEVADGQCAIVAALVLALDEACVLPRERYAHFLNAFWRAMPDEDAVGGAGTMVQRVLDLVAAGAAMDDDHAAAVLVYGEHVASHAAA